MTRCIYSIFPILANARMDFFNRKDVAYFSILGPGMSDIKQLLSTIGCNSQHFIQFVGHPSMKTFLAHGKNVSCFKFGSTEGSFTRTKMLESQSKTWLDLRNVC